MFGNFAIGCGVMAPTGTLNDLSRSLQVSVSSAGQLVTAGAVVMALGAPLLAALVAGMDRRRLLTGALLFFALGHVLAALMPDYAWLLPVRAITMLGAAVFTPQAVAALGVMVAPERRGQAITFVFMGWSLASVLGVPLAAWVGESFGWRWAFGGVAVAAAVVAAWLWRAMPDGVRPAALSRAAWAHVLTSPLLLGTVLVSALNSAGQFTVFAYIAPYVRLVLGGSAGAVSALLLWFGALGVIGNLLLTRYIDRLGPARTVLRTLGMMALSMLLWPLGINPLLLALVVLPWGLGGFATNSAQQARLVQAAPLLAPALIALNSSAMYVGQALGAASGGAVIATVGYAPLHWMGLAWLLAGMGLSHWAARRSLALGAVGTGRG